MKKVIILIAILINSFFLFCFNTKALSPTKTSTYSADWYNDNFLNAMNNINPDVYEFIEDLIYENIDTKPYYMVMVQFRNNKWDFTVYFFDNIPDVKYSSYYKSSTGYAIQNLVRIFNTTNFSWYTYITQDINNSTYSLDYTFQIRNCTNYCDEGWSSNYSSSNWKSGARIFDSNFDIPILDNSDTTINGYTSSASHVNFYFENMYYEPNDIMPLVKDYIDDGLYGLNYISFDYSNVIVTIDNIDYVQSTTITTTFSLIDNEQYIYRYKKDSDLNWTTITLNDLTSFDVDFSSNGSLFVEILDNNRNIVKSSIYTVNSINMIPVYDLSISDYSYYYYNDVQYISSYRLFIDFVNEDLFNKDNFLYYIKYVDDDDYVLYENHRLTNIIYDKYIDVKNNGDFIIKITDLNNNFIKSYSFSFNLINLDHLNSLDIFLDSEVIYEDYFNPCVNNNVLKEGFSCGDYYSSASINLSINLSDNNTYFYYYEINNSIYSHYDFVFDKKGKFVLNIYENGLYTFYVKNKFTDEIVTYIDVNISNLYLKSDIFVEHDYDINSLLYKLKSDLYIVRNTSDYVEYCWNDFYTRMPRYLQDLILVCYTLLMCYVVYKVGGGNK